MVDEILVEQLGQAVEAILAHPDAPPPQVSARLAPLLRVAVALRDLPSEDFKARLKNDLERSVSMGAQAELAEADKTTVNPIREGFRTVTPYIVVREAQEVIDFIQTVFGAEGKIFGTGSEGGIHSEYKIGNSMIMIGGGQMIQRNCPGP